MAFTNDGTRANQPDYTSQSPMSWTCSCPSTTPRSSGFCRTATRSCSSIASPSSSRTSGSSASRTCRRTSTTSATCQAIRRRCRRRSSPRRSAQVGAILILAKPENRDKLIFFMGMERVRYKRPVHPGDVVEIKAHGAAAPQPHGRAARRGARERQGRPDGHDDVLARRREAASPARTVRQNETGEWRILLLNSQFSIPSILNRNSRF